MELLLLSVVEFWVSTSVYICVCMYVSAGVKSVSEFMSLSVFVSVVVFMSRFVSVSV